MSRLSPENTPCPTRRVRLGVKPRKQSRIISKNAMCHQRCQPGRQPNFKKWKKTYYELDSSILQSILPLIFSAVLLLIGWAIGARWGHSATAGYALVCAIVALLVHDVAMTVVSGYSAYKFAKHLRSKDRR